jgi:hypothetical protein
MTVLAETIKKRVPYLTSAGSVICMSMQKH